MKRGTILGGVFAFAVCSAGSGPALGDGVAGASVTGKKFELDHGNPFVTYSVTVNKNVDKTMLAIRTRCKAGDETQNGSSATLLDGMKKGDSTTKQSVFSSITLKSTAAPCEFSFVLKPDPDVEEDAGTVCWKSGKFTAGTCGF